MTAIKIFLLLTIIVFFLPFFCVSCSSYDNGVNFSGLEISTGKYIGTDWRDGNLLGFILLIAPIILLILSFLIYKIKSVKIYNICKNIFFIVPMFDIFAAFIVRYAFDIIVRTEFAKRGDVPVLIDVKYGFVLYIIFNAIIFIFAVANYFAKREF